MTRHEDTLSSRQLKQERRIIVYTPPDYDPKGKPYASIYMFDGEDRDGLVFATWTFENMIADKKIPPMVVVRIVNPNPASRRQLSGHNPFFDFPVKEAVPYVSAHYNVSKSPGETAISDYSLGGLASAYAGLRHSEAELDRGEVYRKSETPATLLYGCGPVRHRPLRSGYRDSPSESPFS